MKILKVTGLIVIVVLAVGPSLFSGWPMSSQSEYTQEMEKFSEFYRKSLEEFGIVGSTFMFIYDNEILSKEMYGIANLEQKRQIDWDTIYHWASITKTFTGIAIMQLRDRGLLELDDPIIKYIPSLREVYNPFGDMKDITIRHLLSHAAGFRGATFPWKSEPWHPHEPLNWEQLEAMFPYTQILFKPGSKWSYSNPGIVFLGRVIELLTTDDWEVYIDKNIFKPLEMNWSYFDATPYFLLNHKCQSYFRQDDKLIPADPDVNTGITVSNGGLKAPFGDFLKYINFLMGDNDKQERYNAVLKRTSLQEMFEPQIEMEYGTDFPGRNRQDAMGLTFFLEDNYGMHFVCHSGGQNAFVTHFYLNPKSRTAYVVGFNTLNMDEKKNTRILDRRIKEYLFEHIFPLFN